MSAAVVLPSDHYCQAQGCANRSYWCMPGPRYMCGRHSPAALALFMRTARPAFSKRQRKQQRHALFQAHAQRLFEACAARGGRGQLECGSLSGLKRNMPLDDVALRWLHVFPHRGQSLRGDGHSVPQLSPMTLGPVGRCWLLSNFLCASACWPCEVDPPETWAAHRDELWADPMPRRRKVGLTEHARAVALGAPYLGAPLYAVHVRDDGERHFFSEVEARVFLGAWYEHLATARSEFTQLRSYRERRGISLRIMGPQAEPLRGTTADAVYADFCDATTPFGHERALVCCLLAAGGECTELPWRRYEREHSELYAGMNLPRPVTFSGLV